SRKSSIALAKGSVTVNKGWGEVFMGATLESVLVGYYDPRLIKYYSKAEGGDIRTRRATCSSK
ncbi:SusD/RagB family nutrient-binding outer membrane lipoprotein, partial [Citrobacter youngae]|uniref:SusD/RagB family nutrient-binding outer membrane lipoprotein n=1 Tax=Citrobacter youngae TaxID=133448 RepID=UPI001954FA45